MILTLTCAIIILLTSIVYYRNKYYNYQGICKSYKADYKSELDKIKEELIEEKQKLAIQGKNIINKKIKKLKHRYNLLAKKLEQEYNDACEEVQNDLIERLTKIDEALAEHEKSTLLKNTLTFSCVCSKDLIPCVIDFTKENTFTCPKCNSVYKVVISAEPILIGRSISKSELASLVENRANEKR